MSSPVLDMENINMRLGPSNMGTCGNGSGVHFGGVTMHPLTVLHPIGSQIHETVKFVRNSYESRTNLPQLPMFRFLTALKAFLCLFFWACANKHYRSSPPCSTTTILLPTPWRSTKPCPSPTTNQRRPPTRRGLWGWTMLWAGQYPSTPPPRSLTSTCATLPQLLSWGEGLVHNFVERTPLSTPPS